MPRVTRTAATTWEGNVARGVGTLTGASSHAFDSLPYTLATRIGNPEGKTSPEELLAASHAACYAMAFSDKLTGRGTPPERLQVSANVGLDPKVGGGVEVSFSHLTVRGRVPGIDQATFEEVAREAEQACPISNVIRGNAAITVEATLD